MDLADCLTSVSAIGLVLANLARSINKTLVEAQGGIVNSEGR